MVRAAALILAGVLAGCGQSDDSVDGLEGLERHVAGNPVGSNPDHWIEMKHSDGVWDRTGLIFGYTGDFEECQKAIAGLKEVNYVREYRCVPANVIE